MGKIGNILLLAVFFLSTVWGIIGCSEEEYIIAKNDVPILEQPYPLNYPSTHPRPNRKIDVLKKGQKARVIGSEHEKDFLVYSIQLKEGTTGYLIYNEKDVMVVSK